MKRAFLSVAAVLAALSGQSAAVSGESLSVLHPMERPAFSQDWRDSTTRQGRQGDWQFVIVRTGKNGCKPLSADGAKVILWQMLPMTTRTPSGEDTATGTFHEALVPRSAATCTLSSLVLAEWQATALGAIVLRQGEDEVLVRQEIKAGPEGPPLPFFIGLNPANLPRGHCFAEDCLDQATLLESHASLLKAHGIQPMQTYIRFPPIKNGHLDLDHGEDGASFRDTVMRHAIHGIDGFPRATRYADPVAYLRALQRTVELEGLKGRAWVYAADEPPDIDALAAHLKLYRKHAPDVRVMVTTDRDPRLEGLIDIYAPVFNRLVSRRHPGFRDYRSDGLWTYLSCMGSCGPHRADKPDADQTPGPETGLADLLIDRPASLLFQFFRTISDRVDGLIYYEATETYRLALEGIDIFSDTWNFGGNGDGLLTFPGRPGEFGLTEHMALPSLRLKLLRHALQNARARTQ